MGLIVQDSLTAMPTDKLSDHSKECGGYEFTYHQEFLNIDDSVPWCAVFRCNKCGHVIRIVRKQDDPARDV